MNQFMSRHVCCLTISPLLAVLLIANAMAADARERHHRAVEEIRRLGGQVDTIPREAKRSSIRRTELWRTVVWLTDAWQGGDDGLRHLADLHNLRELFLERALITDDGLKDEALTAFRDKPNLFELTLVGASFTDQSLSHTLDIPRLFRLRLIDTNTTPSAITTTKQKRPGLQFLSETNP